MIVLYAEDDPEDADVFREVVRSIDANIGCIIAKDGGELLSILANAIVLPDFIFLDVNMPLVGGKECLEEIRKQKDLRSIPVVIYTTSKRPADIASFRELGAHEYVIKPNTFTETVSCLSRILKGG